MDVPDDGTLQRGANLLYKVRDDGTIQDLNTRLIWEVKCSDCGSLHDVNNTYPWSGDGSTNTIWDWLDAINVEGGTGYAGHNDWRIPNVQELLSIVDDGQLTEIDPAFGPVGFGYWSSTTFAGSSSLAREVVFGGVVHVDAFFKSTALSVRAVRGGPK